MAPQLSLSSHVHACFDNGRVVLLDVRANRYWGLPESALDKDGTSIGGLPAEACRLSERAIAALRRQGALSDESPKRPFATERAAIIKRAGLDRRLRTSWTDRALFLRCCLRSDRAVRSGALEPLLSKLTQRVSWPDAPAAAERASVFASLRPWYPHARVCLFDSLALALFLSAGRTPFELVFAVRAAPFAAHCWVESGGEALNDFYDPHASFTPILKVWA